MKKTREKVGIFAICLGKCTIKSLGSELFLPMLNIKKAATNAEEEYKEFASMVLNEYGLKEGDIASSPEVDRMIQQKFKTLRDQEIDFVETKILTPEKFLALSDANPGLTVSELEVLQDFLVIENGKNHQPTN